MEEYVSFDTSKIKQSMIRTEKDLEKDILEVSRILKDITTVDWKE